MHKKITQPKNVKKLKVKGKELTTYKIQERNIFKTNKETQTKEKTKKKQTKTNKIKITEKTKNTNKKQ